MKSLKRRYVYEETYEEVMQWARQHDVRAPNNKNNFPYYLAEYVKALRCNDVARI